MQVARAPIRTHRPDERTNLKFLPEIDDRVGGRPHKGGVVGQSNLGAAKRADAGDDPRRRERVVFAVFDDCALQVIAGDESEGVYAHGFDDAGIFRISARVSGRDATMAWARRA